MTFDPELAAVKSDVVPALDSSPGGSASQDAPGSEGSDLNLSLHHCWVSSRGQCVTENLFIGSEKNILDVLPRSTYYLLRAKEYCLFRFSATGQS